MSAPRLPELEPFAGWSVYVAEPTCVDLPERPCILRASGLLREAVARAANWAPGLWQPPQVHLAAVILNEIRTLPREPFSLPLPADSRLVKISRALLANLSDNRRVDGWAVWAGVSARTIIRRFPGETGYSVKLLEKTLSVLSERSRASGEVEEQARLWSGGLRFRPVTLRPNRDGINCQ